ncbi:MAG TPA: DUF1353 domain-containing protein [Burkholderiaceae bacterium]|nr:DUF1353 domain-containing protein [Burkholderiaceae bacterium]
MNTCLRRLMMCITSALFASSVMAQQPIPPPVLKPFADNRDWVLMENLRYQVGQTSTVIVVPRGFVTDFASIPQAFWSFGLSAHGRYSKAAIVHDYLYWTQGCSREQADNLLMIAMKESRVDAGQRTVIFEGVRLGGNQPWLNNADERKRGLTRVLPEALLDFGPEVTWHDFRATLVPIIDIRSDVPEVPTYCLLGNTTEVPQ